MTTKNTRALERLKLVQENRLDRDRHCRTPASRRKTHSVNSPILLPTEKMFAQGSRMHAPNLGCHEQTWPAAKLTARSAARTVGFGIRRKSRADGRLCSPDARLSRFRPQHGAGMVAPPILGDPLIFPSTPLWVKLTEVPVRLLLRDDLTGWDWRADELSTGEVHGCTNREDARCRSRARGGSSSTWCITPSKFPLYL
jgi:hypothetical protein